MPSNKIVVNDSTQFEIPDSAITEVENFLFKKATGAQSIVQTESPDGKFTEIRSNDDILTLDNVKACQVSNDEFELNGGPRAMGVDQSQDSLQIMIINRRKDKKIQLLVMHNLIGKTKWIRLKEMMKNWKIEKCIVDFFPNSAQVYDFARDFKNEVLIGSYSKKEGNDIFRNSFVSKIKIFREDSRKEIIKMIKNKEFVFFFSDDSEKLKNQLIMFADEENEGEDHFAHALGYALIALNKFEKDNEKESAESNEEQEDYKNNPNSISPDGTGLFFQVGKYYQSTKTNNKIHIHEEKSKLSRTNFIHGVTRGGDNFADIAGIYKINYKEITKEEFEKDDIEILINTEWGVYFQIGGYYQHRSGGKLYVKRKTKGKNLIGQTITGEEFIIVEPEKIEINYKEITREQFYDNPNSKKEVIKNDKSDFTLNELWILRNRANHRSNIVSGHYESGAYRRLARAFDYLHAVKSREMREEEEDN